MAWTIRRRVRLPLGVHLNLSKSGIGYSWGVPGYRVGKDARGRSYRQMSILGTGIYNREYGVRRHHGLALLVFLFFLFLLRSFL